MFGCVSILEENFETATITKHTKNPQNVIQQNDDDMDSNGRNNTLSTHNHNNSYSSSYNSSYNSSLNACSSINKRINGKSIPIRTGNNHANTDMSLFGLVGGVPGISGVCCFMSHELRGFMYDLADTATLLTKYDYQRPSISACVSDYLVRGYIQKTYKRHKT